MSKVLYCIYRKSERAFICMEKAIGEEKQRIIAHVHDVVNYEVSVEDSHYEELLKAFPDDLSEVPWVLDNKQWVKGKVNPKPIVKELEEEIK